MLVHYLILYSLLTSAVARNIYDFKFVELLMEGFGQRGSAPHNTFLLPTYGVAEALEMNKHGSICLEAGE